MSTIAKTPGLVIAHPTLFTALELDLYEKEILANPRATEQDASRFFARFPQFLLLGEGREIRREVQLLGGRGEVLGRVDFFRRSFGRPCWDVIELKTPNIPLVAHPDACHPKLTSPIEGALNQALDYKQLVETDPLVRQALLAKGILVHRPELLVIAGQANCGVSREAIERLFDRVRQRGIRLYAYTDLFEFAKDSYASQRLILIPAKAHEVAGRPQPGPSYEPIPHPRSEGEPPRTVGALAPYTGRFLHAIDRSGRLMIPARWRQNHDGQHYVALPWPVGMDRHILVLPPLRWRQVVDRLAGLLFDEGSTTLLRQLSAGAIMLSPDRVGRLCLPEPLLIRTGLRREALLMGLLDRFEAWSPPRYEALAAEESRRAAEAFRSLDL